MSRAALELASTAAMALAAALLTLGLASVPEQPPTFEMQDRGGRVERVKRVTPYLHATCSTHPRLGRGAHRGW